MEKIGFVGLGIMGLPMAQNLIEAGYDLTVYNRTRSKAEDLAGMGAGIADSPGEVASNSDIVATMLPGPPEVREVMAGDGGLVAGSRPGSLLVDMSTSSPVLARELAGKARERGVGMLDAPVSGGDTGAISGTLSIMAGGAEEDFERARPLFDVMGANVVHVGSAGAGQTVKACNQIVVALALEALSEALVLGSKAGVDPEKLLEVLSAGLASSKVLEVKGEKPISRDFTPGGRVAFQHKDLGIALAAGREYGTPLPVTGVVDQIFEALQTAGKGNWDHSAIITVVENLSQDQ
ncbi:MAG: 2-hydroxy-3-oxopropionate reductase [Rubrobacteraceae bacterium]